MDQNEMVRDAKAVLTIVLRKDGQLGVMGPIAEKLTCYGMLALARDVIAQFKEPSAVINPVIVPPLDMRGNGGRN